MILAARSEKLGVAAVADIIREVPGADVRFVRLDLADQAQIRDCADALIAAGTPLSILVNNAGIMATPLGHTKDGFEMQWGVNQLGHFGKEVTTFAPAAISAVAPFFPRLPCSTY